MVLVLLREVAVEELISFKEVHSQPGRVKVATDQTDEYGFIEDSSEIIWSYIDLLRFS